MPNTPKDMESFPKEVWTENYWNQIIEELENTNDPALFDPLYKKSLSELSDILTSMELRVKQIDRINKKLQTAMNALASIGAETSDSLFFKSAYEIYENSYAEIPYLIKRYWKKQGIIEKNMKYFDGIYDIIEDIN